MLLLLLPPLLFVAWFVVALLFVAWFVVSVLVASGGGCKSVVAG